MWALLNFANPDPENDKLKYKPEHRNLDEDFVKRIVKINYLMRGMEKEKYLKPHFSKYLKPLMKFLFHNADFYNIPDEMKESRDGVFKFPEDSIHPSAMRNTDAHFSKELAGNF